MKNIEFNKVGKVFTFVLIIWFMVTDFLAKINYTATYKNDVAGALLRLGDNMYYLSSAIIFAGSLIALAILFTDNKKNNP